MSISFRLLLFFFITLPHSSTAQPSGVVAPSRTYCTSWQSLQRPTFRNPLNTFYRFRNDEGEYKLELKVSAGGMHFVVAKNAQLELITETGSEIALYNEQYERTCKGCGSIAHDADIPGVTISFPVSRDGILLLTNDYITHVRLYLANVTLGSKITLMRCETFKETLQEFIHEMEHCK